WPRRSDAGTGTPQRASDAQDGTVGVTRIAIPASAGVRSPLRWLQPPHAATVFSHVFLPPREAGVTWSTVVAMPPQYAHVRWLRVGAIRAASATRTRTCPRFELGASTRWATTAKRNVVDRAGVEPAISSVRTRRVDHSSNGPWARPAGRRSRATRPT